MLDTDMTTDDVLASLARIRPGGVAVTRNMLLQDVRDGYLQPPLTNPEGRNRPGLWERASYRRAVYLYRLRGRGAHGQVLRVLLFLRDGWGWERVKPLCVAGLRKIIGVQKSAIRDHLYGATELRSLYAKAEQISRDAGIVNPEVGRFIWGMGLYGRPLGGASLQPMVSAFASMSVRDIPSQLAWCEEMFVQAGLTWDDVIDIAQRADCQQANRARCGLLRMLGQLRRMGHNQCREQGVPPNATNLLTMGGRSARELGEELRSMPGRITPAQLLAALLAGPLAVERILTPEVAELLQMLDILNDALQRCTSPPLAGR